MLSLKNLIFLPLWIALGLAVGPSVCLGQSGPGGAADLGALRESLIGKKAEDVIRLLGKPDSRDGDGEADSQASNDGEAKSAGKKAVETASVGTQIWRYGESRVFMTEGVVEGFVENGDLTRRKVWRPKGQSARVERKKLPDPGWKNDWTWEKPEEFQALR